MELPELVDVSLVDDKLPRVRNFLGVSPGRGNDTNPGGGLGPLTLGGGLRIERQG